ncbi:hypothetical protein [Streptomyces hoynatensis]|uniref:Uncharacterized protein n=1 Tax=Streptomyces hoynatensis TaxID=1141874 RepID=A0A3A9YT99_9ACTN|nr:hypothetical protein [Streptomyces hoynatensis]RKN39263.1 hypothetical protein D7294_22095 [Streptomyces hoynatensis]
MTPQDIITRHLCMAVDVEKYSRLDTPHQEAAQADLVRILEDAAVLSGLDRTRWGRQAQGDQEFTVLPQDTSEAALLGDFVRHLAATLAERNLRHDAAKRLRLRLAFDIGVARTAALGYSGPTPVSVARYLNAPQLKRVLAAVTSTNLVVIVADRLYQDVVRLRAHGLNPEEYARVHIQQKEFTGYGWIHLPGHGPADIRAAVARTSAPARASTAEVSNGESRNATTSARELGRSRMNTPAEIAALAASAVIGAMATDTWAYVRARCAALLGRHAPEASEQMLHQLDAFEQALAGQDPAAREHLAAHFTQRTAEQLAVVADRSAEAAEAVRLLAMVPPATSAPSGFRSGQVFTDIDTGGGDFIASGRDTNVWKKDR